MVQRKCRIFEVSGKWYLVELFGYYIFELLEAKTLYVADSWGECRDEFVKICRKEAGLDVPVAIR